jgi:hypothetical protein
VSAQSAASVTSSEANLSVNATLPGAPTGLSAVRGNNSIILSWTAPSSNGGALITGYAVQYAQSGSTTWTTFADGTTTGSGTSITIINLTAGTFYQLRVAAVNSVGQGSYGTMSGTVKFGPQFLSGTNAGSGSLGASWVGVGDVTNPLTLTNAYFDSTAAGPKAQINVVAVNAGGAGASATGTLNYYYQSTGASGRVVRVEKNGSVIASETSSTSSVTVVAGDTIVVYFYPAAAGDRITISAAL